MFTRVHTISPTYIRIEILKNRLALIHCQTFVSQNKGVQVIK
ncbi:MAG: hypothetical protein JWN76_1278 [Chitinophagaceae bacterium]|nr:hypothetical protein [Chitinophagaceae bacterium]